MRVWPSWYSAVCRYVKVEWWLFMRHRQQSERDDDCRKNGSKCWCRHFYSPTAYAYPRACMCHCPSLWEFSFVGSCFCCRSTRSCSYRQWDSAKDTIFAIITWRTFMCVHTNCNFLIATDVYKFVGIKKMNKFHLFLHAVSTVVVVSRFHFFENRFGCCLLLSSPDVHSLYAYSIYLSFFLVLPLAHSWQWFISAIHFIYIYEERRLLRSTALRPDWFATLVKYWWWRQRRKRHLLEKKVG